MMAVLDDTTAAAAPPSLSLSVQITQNEAENGSLTCVSCYSFTSRMQTRIDALAGTPFAKFVIDLNLLAQRWISGDRSEDVRKGISDQMQLLLGLMTKMRDYKLTNPAHRGSIGESGLVAIEIWQRILADLPCGALSECPSRHPLKTRSNYPKGTS